MNKEMTNKTKSSLLRKLNYLMIDISSSDLILSNNEHLSNYSGYPFILCFSEKFIKTNQSILYNFYKSITAHDEDYGGLWYGDEGEDVVAYMEFDKSEVPEVINFFETAFNRKPQIMKPDGAIQKLHELEDRACLLSNIDLV